MTGPRTPALVAVLAALVLLVAIPAHAGAVTFGADLSASADNTATCGQIFPGAGSCLFWTGAPGPSFYAPASGTVTSVHVKTGPAAQGPMQIVVMRSLYQNRAGDPGHPYYACCFLEQYGPTFTPGSNGVTTVPTSLSVVEDPTPPAEDTSTVARGDFLALSVLAPDVPVPLTSSGGGSYFGYAPAPDPQRDPAPGPNPYTGAAVTDGFGGHLLMNADLDTGGGGPAGGGGGATALRLPRSGQLSDRAASLALRCILTTTCRGSLTLTARPAAASANAKVLGRAHFKIAAGRKARVKVKLNAAGRRRAAGRRSLKVVAKARIGGRTISSTVRLRAPTR